MIDMVECLLTGRSNKTGLLLGGETITMEGKKATLTLALTLTLTLTLERIITIINDNGL